MKRALAITNLLRGKLMTKFLTFVLAAFLALRADVVLSADRPTRVPAPHCETIDAMKASLKDAKFTALSPGQFHFMAGVYVASPITPPGGLPPGDGALLIEMKNKAALVWTRGKQAASPKSSSTLSNIWRPTFRCRSTPSFSRFCARSRRAPTKRSARTIPMKNADCEPGGGPSPWRSSARPFEMWSALPFMRPASPFLAGSFSRSRSSANNTDRNLERESTRAIRRTPWRWTMPTLQTQIEAEKRQARWGMAGPDTRKH